MFACSLFWKSSMDQNLAFRKANLRSENFGTRPAQNGYARAQWGNIEIMALMQARVDANTLIVMAGFALPVEATETRVNAQAQAYEYMTNYSESCEPVGRLEKVVGCPLTNNTRLPVPFPIAEMKQLNTENLKQQQNQI
uniref:JAB1/MPN/MOV34 metalloenzyme domain-containing protein n=1 Tax=Globodera rostochiensis TaxID=31243 RepID=A0A914HR52_GLORO